mgnify:CR=1 FL=1
MSKIKAFTLIEVMISIFIFTTAMIGYMAFHAHSMSVIFDNESAQFAHSLAFNLVEEINSMSYKDFAKLVENTGSQQLDTFLKGNSYFGDNFGVSPFYMTDTLSYKFNRYIKSTKYTDMTGTFAQTGTFTATLYHVEVSVYWPKRGFGTVDCTSSLQNFETKCNEIRIPIVRSNKQTFK